MKDVFKSEWTFILKNILLKQYFIVERKADNFKYIPVCTCIEVFCLFRPEKLGKLQEIPGSLKLIIHKMSPEQPLQSKNEVIS